MTVFVFGHKSPDTDTVAASIAAAYLKNKQGLDAKPVLLGNINKESQYVLNYFKTPVPNILKNVRTQVKDINYEKPSVISPETSIFCAYKTLEEKNMRTLLVLDKENNLLGLITMKDIAIELVKGDFRTLKTSLDNIVHDLNGKLLVEATQDIEGCISVIAYYHKTIEGSLKEDDIIIVGDRFGIIEHAISSKVKLIIVTGNKAVPKKYLTLAAKKGVNMVSVPTDTYTTAKLINKCKYVSLIMKTKDIVKFNENEYIDEIKDDMLNTNYRNYPVIDNDNKFLGLINRRHLLIPGRKQVILVDHNEYVQSAEGLDEAEILEIIDHHKIGDISTSLPINFRNMPVGSTCTIIYQMFKDQGIELPYNLAGLLISGIISDTLMFKSPTTTPLDIHAVQELNSKLNLNLEHFAMEMFRAGTSLEGYSIDEIFYKDFKEFILENNRTGMSQVFTLDIEEVKKREKEIIEFIENVHYQKNYYLTLLLITDILKEGSYLLYKCNNANVIPTAFNTGIQQGVFVPSLVSRKKQVVPKVLEAINMLR